MINEFIEKFTDKKIDFVKIKSKYFLVSSELLKIKEKFSFEPLGIGIFLGEEKKGDFYPSLALLEILSKYSKEKVILNDLGELDFIYGKNLRERHILKVKGKSYLKLVQNEYNENLGYGKLKEKSALKNKLDRGDFLRREK